MSELQTYIQIGRRNWWIVALTAGIALAASIILSSITEPTYQTQARFIVSPNSILEADRDIIDSLEALDKRSVVVTYAEVLRSNRILNEAREELGMEAVGLAGYGVTAVVLPEANVLELTVTGPEPEQTAALANTIGEEAIAYMSNLYRVHQFDFLDRAPVPQRPAEPQPVQNAVLSVALGLGVGLLLVVVRERLLPPVTALISEETAVSETNIPNPVTGQEKNALNKSQTLTANGSSHDIKSPSQAR